MLPWAQIGTALASKVLPSVLGRLGRKKPMVVYGKAHPNIDRAIYARNRFYRQAVDELHAAHVRQFGIGWTSTSDPAAIVRGVWARYAQLKKAATVAPLPLRTAAVPGRVYSQQDLLQILEGLYRRTPINRR